ncbi:unnamed protein product [Phytomonas sp. EM1]|nr:unnamed protein product [Phytomonas sp. EM1]|eukprot:CCW64080.1 unnamed protein product [Phytomonas sp. isolate EM1]
MPGRHGKQRIRKKKSKRAPVTEMERTLKDSIYGRKRKERAILKELLPPKITPKINRVALSTNLPMFTSLTGTPSNDTESKAKVSSSNPSLLSKKAV